MSRDRFRFLERHGFVKLSSFGRTMVDELRGMLVASGGGNSRMLATAGTISARRIRIQRMTAVCGGMSAVVLQGYRKGVPALPDRGCWNVITLELRRGSRWCRHRVVCASD